ncbi:hypothetical protein ACTQY8_05535 [Collinsella bouchesdurhonensis]|uniref:hypothetical protein n=1 Tax=Collinsella bouchesdurhonensis TaxID=1907654 RepID=UPI003F8DED96
MSERKAILISHDGNYHCTRCGAHDFFDCCENSCSKNPALTAIKFCPYCGAEFTQQEGVI